MHRSGGDLPFSPTKSAAIFAACCRLHNFCIERHVFMPDIVDEDGGDDEICPDLNVTGRAVATRQHYVNLA